MDLPLSFNAVHSLYIHIEWLFSLIPVHFKWGRKSRNNICFSLSFKQIIQFVLFFGALPLVSFVSEFVCCLMFMTQLYFGYWWINVWQSNSLTLTHQRRGVAFSLYKTFLRRVQHIKCIIRSMFFQIAKWILTNQLIDVNFSCFGFFFWLV